jgi:hypothetical protein
MACGRLKDHDSIHDHHYCAYNRGKYEFYNCSYTRPDVNARETAYGLHSTLHSMRQL